MLLKNGKTMGTAKSNRTSKKNISGNNFIERKGFNWISIIWNILCGYPARRCVGSGTGLSAASPRHKTPAQKLHLRGFTLLSLPLGLIL